MKASPVNSCTRSTRDGVGPERQGRRRQSRCDAAGLAHGLASPSASRPCVSRPVSGLASGSLSLKPHLPVLAAQWSVAVSGSLTVAWAAPALHSYANAHRLPVSPQGRLCSPGTPETNETLRGRMQACKSGTVTRVSSAYHLDYRMVEQPEDERGIAQGHFAQLQTWCLQNCHCGLHSPYIVLPRAQCVRSCSSRRR